MRLLAATLWLAGCTTLPTVFICDNDAACASGTCELTGYCSFADATCAGGSRYGRFAAELTGTCVVRTDPCVKHLDAGGKHTCAIKNDGSLLCWGRNSDGQLGTGGMARNLTPIAAGPAGMMIAGAARVGAGGAHTCVMRGNGSLACWGKNDAGQVGFDTVGMPVLTPREVALSTLQTLAAGRDHTCVTLGNAAAWCFGSDGDGQLGDGGGGTNMGPRNVLEVAGVQQQAADLAAGARHTCARLANNSARCWGRNDRGQLGLGNMGAPVTMPAALSSLGTNVAVIATGTDFTCALLRDDTVSCWGANDALQLGTSGADTAVPRPLEALGKDTLELALGDRHACARLRDGTVRCWGNGDTPRTVMRADGRTLSRVTAISAGDAHTCATTRDSTIYCWGDNSDGQIGDGTTDPRPTAVPVLLSCP